MVRISYQSPLDGSERFLRGGEPHEDLLLFMHIGHTGGLSFIEVSQREYSSLQLFWEDSDRTRGWHAISSWTEQQASALRCVTGHTVKRGIEKLLPRHCFFSAFVRDPVQHALSCHYYKHAMDSGGAKSVGDDAPEFSGTLNLNYQTRWMYSPLIADSLDESIFDSILHFVESHFPVIGVTDLYDESMFVMHHMFGWQKAKYWRMQYRTKGRPGREGISDQIRDQIRNENPFDVRLYDYARERLLKQVSEIEKHSGESFGRYRQEREVYSEAAVQLPGSCHHALDRLLANTQKELLFVGLSPSTAALVNLGENLGHKVLAVQDPLQHHVGHRLENVEIERLNAATFERCDLIFVTQHLGIEVLVPDILSRRERVVFYGP